MTFVTWDRAAVGGLDMSTPGLPARVVVVTHYTTVHLAHVYLDSTESHT